MKKTITNKGFVKFSRVYSVIYLLINLMSVVFYMRNKFGVNGVRKIGDFDVTLTKDKFEGDGTIVAETNPMPNMSKAIVVRTDLFFRLMPASIQNCVIAHECGHHLYSERHVFFSVRTVEDEHKADTYSVQLYGKDATIRMLKWISCIAPFNKEIKERISLIERM